MNFALFKRITVIAACVLAMLGVSSMTYAKDKVSQPAVTAEWPDFLRDAMKRELRVKKSTPLSLADGLVTGTVPGEFNDAPEEVEEGAWYFSLDLGVEDRVQCWVYLNESHLTTLLSQLHDILITGVAEYLSESPAVRKMPYYVYSDILDGQPMLTSEWFFLVGEEQPQAGLSKIRVAQKDGATLACAQVALGYRKTFATLFEDLLGSLTVSLDRPKPYYRETYLVKIADQRAGVALTSFYPGDDDSTLAISTTSMLLQADENSLVSSDSEVTSYANPDGTVIRAYDVTMENGELKTDLSLERNNEGNWMVSGPFNGKEIAVEIETQTAPMSPLGLMILTRDELAAKNKDAVSFPMWLADADPSSFLEGSLKLDKISRKGGRGVITTGPLAMNAKFDKSGSASSVDVALGPNTMRMERVTVSGELRNSAAE
ncbi:MAG: hypothetical protein AB8G17_14835 [Gammaproteobacteria bacterium]